MSEDAEELREVVREFQRYFGLASGGTILAVSAGIGIFYTEILLRNRALLAFLGFLNLTSVYWVISGLKPELQLAELFSRYTGGSREEVLEVFVPVSIIVSQAWIFYLAESLFFPVAYTLVTMPAAMFFVLNHLREDEGEA